MILVHAQGSNLCYAKPNYMRVVQVVLRSFLSDIEERFGTPRATHRLSSLRGPGLSNQDLSRVISDD